MILGLDVSTSYTGWCLLQDDGTFFDVGYLILKKMSESERMDVIEAFIRDIYLNHSLFRIFVEAPLGRSNNQNVVNLLQRWNGQVCAITYMVTRIAPELITELNARKANGIKVPKGVKGIEKKRFVLNFVRNLGIVNENKWELKRTGNYKDYCYDMADSIVVAKGGYLR